MCYTGSYTILWTHKNTAHADINGSTALAAAVVLPRYGGLNYACGINEVLKKKRRKMSRRVLLYNARVKILNESASFTTRMYHGD